MNDPQWRASRESLLLAIADDLERSLQHTASFVIGTVSPSDVIPSLAAHEVFDLGQDYDTFECFVADELWDTLDDGGRIVASFDWVRDYATISLTRLPDGRCMVWWNDDYAQHLAIGLMRDEDCFSDFFEAYNSRWHDLAGEGGQWGGVPRVISDVVPRGVVLRTIFRFLLYSGQTNGYTAPHAPGDDASDYYHGLVAEGRAEIADEELAMPPWVRDQERAIWEAVYAEHGTDT